MPSLLSRDAILQAQDLTFEDIKVPEWGGLVRIRMLTGAERDEFEESVIRWRGRDYNLNLRGVRAKLVSLCLIDEQGKRLFTEKDIKALGEKSAAALDRVFTAAQKLNGLTDQDVEDLAGNFLKDQNGNSISN